MGNLFALLRPGQHRAAEHSAEPEMRTVRLFLMDRDEPVTETADRQRAEQLFVESKGWPNAASAELVGADDDVLDRW